MEMILLDGIHVPKSSPIFILEDIISLQHKLILDLKELGFDGEFITAATLKEALEKISKFKSKIIFSDWNLPDGVGIDFVRKVRSIPELNQSCLLMSTTIDDINNILEAVNSGADGYVVKPWSLEDLEKNISFAFNKRHTI